MKKLTGIGLIIIGIALITLSILALIQAYETMQNMKLELAQDFGYLFGSILIPLLLTVSGRWIYRRGKFLFKSN